MKKVVMEFKGRWDVKIEGGPITPRDKQALLRTLNLAIRRDLLKRQREGRVSNGS